MQTFLPYPSFKESAKCLDNKRLGKQRVEAWQIYCAITDPGYGWQKHPAVNMWREHLGALVEYGLAVCAEWKNRGFCDGAMRLRFETLKQQYPEFAIPPFVVDPKFNESHKSNLIRKNSDHYSKLWPEVSADLPYYWPTK